MLIPLGLIVAIETQSVDLSHYSRMNNDGGTTSAAKYSITCIRSLRAPAGAAFHVNPRRPCMCTCTGLAPLFQALK